MSLQRIQNCEGDWVTEKQQMVEKAVSYFQKQFSEEKTDRRYDMIQNIPTLVTQEQNVFITELSGIEEVKTAV